MSSDYIQELTPSVGVRPVKKLPRNSKVLLAAWYLADGMKNETKIAAELQISRATLISWMKNEEFKAQVAAYRAEINERIMASDYALRENRVREASELVNRMKGLILARAEAGQSRAARNAADPGEETGLLAEANGGRTTIMATDAQLTKELRETLKYISQEIGQFQQKMDVTSGGQPITFTIPMSDAPEESGDADK